MRLRWRSRLGAGGLAVLALLLLAIPAGPAAALTQRMVIAAGCYVLAPGQSIEVAAYCLDENRQAPARGAILAKAPGALGDGSVSRADGSTIGLDEALRRYLVQIEGLGDFSHVQIKNLGSDRLELCLAAPTVVMAPDGSTADLARVYDRIVEILARAPQTENRSGDRPTTDPVQRLLWDAVTEAATQPEAKAAPRPAPAVPSAAKRTPAASGPATCGGRTDSVTFCAEKP
jgi:hypothetical protein